MVGTCRKRTISAPELETSRHERWEQTLAKEIRKQQKIFYHPHVYVKNVGPCIFLCLFPCSLTNLMFPCSLRLFCFVPVFPLPNFPCSLVPQKPLGDPHKRSFKSKDTQITETVKPLPANVLLGEEHFEIQITFTHYYLYFNFTFARGNYQVKGM